MQETVQTFNKPSELGRGAGRGGTDEAEVQSYLQEGPSTLPVDGVVAVAL